MDVTSLALRLGNRRNRVLDAVSHLSVSVVGAELRGRPKASKGAATTTRTGGGADTEFHPYDEAKVKLTG
jgi:hypothetical protein